MGRDSEVIQIAPEAQAVQLHDFNIKRELGRGAFGRVYLAELGNTGKLYAIKGIRKDKLIDSNQIVSTFNEMNIMLQVQHPNLCGMEYFFQTAFRLYFVMPHIPGGDMHKLLRQYR